MEASENILRQRSCDRCGERLLNIPMPQPTLKGTTLATGVPAFAIKKLSPRDARWIIRLKCAFASAALSYFCQGLRLIRARGLALELWLGFHGWINVASPTPWYLIGPVG
jgi:hypothetical protein